MLSVSGCISSRDLPQSKGRLSLQPPEALKLLSTCIKYLAAFLIIPYNTLRNDGVHSQEALFIVEPIFCFSEPN